MCGGSLEVVDGTSTCICEYCGTQQTLPTAKDELIQTLFNRANTLRLKSEFDKAAEVYEKILQRSETEAEAYWGLILCKYGIEYVEEPDTLKRIPTCHRASYDAVVTDEDYKNAIKYADMVQRSIYESEAVAIDEIQKGIITIAQKEDPYDVFICYKETDENGKRTPDSVIANDIYYQLTHEGFKVFYAAISLEDKLGTEYEPYIFSALNTSKAMLALGTKPEYFNAVWVKNEWSRFLKIMKKDRSRLLIPCYRDMDPYELPEEFAHLQAQDMSKIGFINDIVRGLKKVIVREQETPSTQKTIIQQGAVGTIAIAQIKRGNMALEDHDWEKADGFFEEALNLEPECAEAYIGKLLVRDKMPDFATWLTMQKEKNSAAITERLEACPEDINYIERKTDELQIEGYLHPDFIRKCYEYDRGYESTLSCRKQQRELQLRELESDRLLTRACKYAKGETKRLLDEALGEITLILDKRILTASEEDARSIAQVKEAYAVHLIEADKKAKKAYVNAQERREKQYQDAVAAMEQAFDWNTYTKAQEGLKAMKGYKDSDHLAEMCQKELSRIDEEKRRLEEERRQEHDRQESIRKAQAKQKVKKTRNLIIAITAVAVICIVVLMTVVLPNQKMNKAMDLLNSGNYEEAYALLDELGKDDVIESNKYDRASTLLDMGEYEAAYALLSEIGKTDVINSSKYERAMSFLDAGDYEAAYALFEETGNNDIIEKNKYERAVSLINSDDYEAAYILLDGLDYEDSVEIKNSIKLQYQSVLLAKAEVGSYVVFGSYEQDNITSNGKEDIEWVVAKKDGDDFLILSKKALDCQQYNTSRSRKTLEPIKWENCSLRKWLNSTFFNEAFSSSEREMIKNVTITTQDSGYSTKKTTSTTDKVFLLTSGEMHEYFGYGSPLSDEHNCQNTEYCHAQAEKVHGGGSYWLRSHGDTNSASVGPGVSNYVLVDAYEGVRPAIWISTKH